MKNVSVYAETGIKINKPNVHAVVKELKNELGFVIDDLEINFVTPETIHFVNKEYLDHDYETDVITFNYSEEYNNLEAEIFISPAFAAQSAKRFGVTVDNELMRLVVHAILHCFGYHDYTPPAKKKMKQKENYFVNKLRKIKKILQ